MEQHIYKCNLIVAIHVQKCCDKVKSLLVSDHLPWLKDEKNGPDYPTTSTIILLKWPTTKGNYNKYRGSRTRIGKGKIQCCSLLSKQTKQAQKGMEEEVGRFSHKAKTVKIAPIGNLWCCVHLRSSVAFMYKWHMYGVPMDDPVDVFCDTCEVVMKASNFESSFER